MIKKLIICCFFYTAITAAQNYENDWRGFFSFQNVIDLVEGDDRLIVAAENAVMIYDLITDDLTTITPINGLSGERISSLFYSETHNVIFLGYETGLVELILEDKTIVKVVDILNKPVIPPDRKRINGFNQFEDKVYFATDYGLSVFNLNGLEFGDSYYLGNLGAYIKVYQSEVYNGFIYAIGQGIVRRADLNNPNLIHYSAWSTVSNQHFIGIDNFNDKLYTISNTNQLFRFNGVSFELLYSFPQSNIKMYSNEQYLNVISNTQAHTFDVNMSLINTVTSLIDYEYILSSGVAYNQAMYLGTTAHGVLVVPFGSNTAEQILPNGPLMNFPFAIDAAPGRLWVSFGEHSVTYNPYPLKSRGVSLFLNEKWTNIPFEDVFEARALSHVKINPYNPSEVYISSMIDGLLKIKDSVPEILYDETNSSLDVLNPDPTGLGIRILGADFDQDGNLWFTRSAWEKGLYKMSPSGQMQGFDVTNVISIGQQNSEYALTKLTVERGGSVFFGSGQSGVIGYNPALNKFRRIDENIGNGNLASHHVKAIATDHRNQIWIGTYKGLRVLYNVSGFFDDGANVDTQPIIIMENGIPQELLYQQTIMDIEVDGANNKWVATASSGAFYFSPNGQETLLHFTKDNSPLPSNTVLDIAIDPASGEVFFATLNGLVSYRGSSTAARDNLENLRAFPNPVRPGYTGQVTIDGLTNKANVKITDVNGNLVYEAISNGGSILWDTTAFGKYKVATGVYFIMATTEDATETNIAKLLIVR